MTWQTLDLSTAVFLGEVVDGGPYGRYGGGVIYTNTGYPDFYFPSVKLDPSTAYMVEVTYDPTSVHDGGGRYTNTIFGLRAGLEAADYDSVNYSGNVIGLGPLADASGNTADVVTMTLGPGVGGWDDPIYGVPLGWVVPFIESDVAGAVSQVRISPPIDLAVFAQYAPPTTAPLRQYPRDDGLGASTPGRNFPPPTSFQRSHRPAGYL